jgi:hypothetical protein
LDGGAEQPHCFAKAATGNNLGGGAEPQHRFTEAAVRKNKLDGGAEPLHRFHTLATSQHWRGIEESWQTPTKIPKEGGGMTMAVNDEPDVDVCIRLGSPCFG